MKRSILTLLALLLLATPQTVLASDEGGTSLEEGPSVRRLLLLRSGRFEVQPAVGFSINDPFMRNMTAGASIAYYFNNSIGVGGDFGFAAVHMATDETTTVQQDFYSPRVREQLSITQLNMNFDVGMIWAPVFGKFAVFGVVLNYDLHGFVGAGALMFDSVCADPDFVNPDNGNTCTPIENIGGMKFAGALGVGSRIYINNFMALNFELRDYVTSFSEYARNNTDNAELQSFVIGTVGLSIFMPFDVYVSR